LPVVPPQFAAYLHIAALTGYYHILCAVTGAPVIAYSIAFGKPLGKVFGESFHTALHLAAALWEEGLTLTWFRQRI